MQDSGSWIGPKPDPRLGTTLDERYRIEKKLGEGGMGIVYLAEHMRIRKKVAIKCLHALFAENPDIVARFHREALAATQIGHPNIVEVNDMGRLDDGGAYMVLEFLDGKDLREVLQSEGPLPLERAARIAIQICDALGAAHAKGIVHRDLKPANVFLVKRGDDPDFVKVLDFGISKFQQGLDGGLSEGMSRTETGAALGSPHYMAPEQAHGLPDADHRVDIYALGVLLFRALTSKHPFDDSSYPRLLLKILNDPPPAATSLRPELPAEIDALLCRLMAKDKAHRFQTCAEVKAALLPFAGEFAGYARMSAQSWTMPPGVSPRMSGTSPMPNTPMPNTPMPNTPVRAAPIPLADPSVSSMETTQPPGTGVGLQKKPAASKGPLVAVAVLVGLGALAAVAYGVLGKKEEKPAPVVAAPEPVKVVEPPPPPPPPPAPEPAKVEPPPAPEPAKVEPPPAPEPAKVEPAKVEPAKVEPAKPRPPRRPPQKPNEPAKPAAPDDSPTIESNPYLR